MELINNKTIFMDSIKQVKIVLLALLISNIGFAQTFTMGKKCRASLELAQEALAEEQYNEALNYYNAFDDKCNTKDAKEIGAYGKAEALNGLGRYEEAIVEADKALEVTKSTSINAYFQKAVAYSKLGKLTEAKDALDKVIQLTETNENVKERASNYALMAAFYERKMNDQKQAQDYLDKAKELDPSNIDYLIQEGGMYSTAGNFDKALVSYNAAVELDDNSKDLYVARSNARIKHLNAKYGTEKTQDLRGKMTSQEKKDLCSDLNKASELGYKNMNRDMFKALICK